LFSFSETAGQEENTLKRNAFAFHEKKKNHIIVLKKQRLHHRWHQMLL